jgi:3-methyladenine DNA glycosylase AlkD
MDIIEIFREHKNIDDAQAMSKYQRNLFPFLGIRSPERRELSKDFIKDKLKIEKYIDWNFVFYCYEKQEREFHYLAIDYLSKGVKYLSPIDCQNLERLIITNSWWDSIDSIAPVVGTLVKNYPELKSTFIMRCIENKNIWMKRVGIIYQLSYKENTDTKILEKAILSNTGTKEFFVNKAIGWALRNYSKTSKKWVREFIEKNIKNLDSLSIREGSKYL